MYSRTLPLTKTSHTDTPDQNNTKWIIPPFRVGASVIVSGLSETGDSSFSGHTGVIKSCEFHVGRGNSYTVVVDSTTVPNISPKMIRAA